MSHPKRVRFYLNDGTRRRAKQSTNEAHRCDFERRLPSRRRLWALFGGFPAFRQKEESDHRRRTDDQRRRRPKIAFARLQIAPTCKPQNHSEREDRQRQGLGVDLRGNFLHAAFTPRNDGVPHRVVQTLQER